MGDVTQKITFKGAFDVRDVMQGIDQIKKNLGNLSLGPGTEAEFNKLFQKIERNAEKANNAMASGFKNKGDVKAYEDAMRQISVGYDDIITKAKVLSNNNKINLQVDDTAIKSLNSEMKALQDNIKQAKDSLRLLKTTTGRDMGNIATKYKSSGAKSWNEAVQAFKDGDIQKTDDAIKVLENTIKGAQTRAQKNGSVLGSDWQEKIKDVEALRDALENYKDAQNNIKTSENELAQKEKELNDIMSKGANLLAQTADIGEQGAQAFRDYARESTDAAKGTQQLNSELEHFKGKAAYFFGLSNAINLFKRALRSAYNTVKDLDAVMTETAVVTNFDVGDMWSQLPEYTQRANELGVTIHDTYEAATLFYQQGLKTNQVMEISNETLKMARIAGLDAATASDRMTNALRGFNMELDKVNAQRVNDVYSKLAAITASNTDEISTAMTKVASLAHNANMEFETTAAFLAQMIETTRESAETAGTALKTVVARFSEVKKLYSKGELMGNDEEGEVIDVNKVSTALRSAGINLNEYLTGAKGLDDIFIELAEKWDSLDQVQQRYIATMAAGSRQQSRFIALMSNSARTTELVEAANNANGASQEQYGKTLESLQTKLARLKNAWNEFILGLANSDVIKGAVDMLTNLITAINNLIKAISGKNSAAKMITTFFTAFTGFKIGQKMFGGTQFGKFFSGLTQTVGEEGKKGATTFVGNFYKNLGSKIRNGDIKNAFLKNFNDIKGTIGDVSQYFNPRQIAGLMPNVTKDEALTNIINKFDTNTTTDEQIKGFQNAIGPEIENGTLTLGKLNKALKDSGQNFKVSAKDAEKFGLVVGDNNGTVEAGTAALRRFSAGAVLVGTAMIVASNALENSESSFSSLAPLLKIAGVAIVTFGTLMSVWLPLQAQLGATKLSATIFGIPIIGWIAAAISAVLALGAAFLTWKKSTSFETRMKNATEACKNAADAADEATKAYEKLGEAWDSLNDKYAAIDNAVAGTQQWRDAIKAANDEVLNLVNSYEDLDVVVGDDGRLTITEESKNAVQNNLRNKKESAQAASIGAQLNKNRIQAELSQQKKDSWSLTGMGAGTWMIGNEEFSEDKVKQKVIEEYNKGQIKSTEDLQKYVRQFMPSETVGKPVYDKIRDYEFNALKEYAKDKSFSEQSQAQFSGLASNALTNMSNQDAIKYAKNLVNAKSAEEIYNKELEKNQGNELSKKQKRQKFAENSGYSNYAEWKQANGDKDIDDKDLDSRLAAQEAQKKLTQLASQFETKFGNLTSEQLKYFQQEGGGALTANDFEEIRKKGGARGIVDRIGDEEYFKSLEIDREAYISQLQEELNEAEKYVTVKSGSILEGLGENITKNLTTSIGKSLTENFESILIASGKEGVDTLQKQIKELTDDMDPEKAKAFTTALTKIDWSSTNSIHSLSDLAAEYGIADDRIEQLENDIIKLNNASLKVDLSKLTEQLKSLLKIGKGIKTGTQGRNFSEDDYKKLIEQAGVDADKFVYNIETGEYNYTGQLSDILKAVNQLVDNSFDTKQLEKDIASGKVAQDLFSKNGNIDNVKDKSSFVKDYIEQAGENSKIQLMAWSEAYDKARSGDYTAMNKLYEIIKNDKDKLGDNQGALDTTKFNAEVMRAQMNSGAENAGRAIAGNEAALKALMGQVSASSMSEELRQKLLSGMESDDEEERKKAIQQAGSITDTFTQAKSFGAETKDIEAYVNSLRQLKETQELEEDELYRLALAEVNYQNGQQALKDSYSDWSKLIQKNGGIVPNGTIEEAKIFDQLNEDLKKMLNLTGDLPKDFLKAEGSADLLKKAIKGDKNAITQLRKEAAKIIVGNLEISDDSKNKITSQIDKLAEEMPDLKMGATLDSTKAGQGLMDMVNKAGMSVDQIQKLFNGLGWAPEITWKKATLEDVTKTAQGGVIKQPDPSNPGKTIDVPLDGFNEWATNHDIFIPQVGGKTSYVAPKPSKSDKPKTKKKGGGGGKKSKKKAETWENPYDELYNLQEKINESLRKREALERRYQKLLKQEKSELSDIRKSYYDQIGQLRYEANLQKELEAGRLRQINNLGNQTYTTSAGKKTTFAKMGVTGYAHYDQEKNTMVIDWEGLEALAKSTKGTEKGKAVEAYISKLEELSQSYEKVRDDLWAIEDKIEELRQAAVESYLSFEDRVMEAVVNKYQKEIDSYQAMSDAIDKVNNEVINSLREQIDLSRQIRDNTKKEEDISKKENRLAYLQRDTSGANALEILKLQKELEDDREGYTDTLVDQAIDKMQKDADDASEQRQRQIEIMQTQLDIAQETGALWQEVYDLMNKASESEIFSEDSELAKLLKDGEAFKSLSNIGQKSWWEEVGKAFREAIIGRGEAEDKFQTDANNDGTIENTGTSNTLKEVAESNTQADVKADKVYDRTNTENYGAAAAIVMGGTNHGGWGAKQADWEKNLDEKGFDPAAVIPKVKSFSAKKKAWDAQETKKQKAYKKKKKKYTKKAWTGWKVNGVTDWNDYKMSQFKTGGLADSTGPAWLDGTKTKPELVLNPQDTKNFIALKDILASLLNTQSAKGSVSGGGDNYFDINISADIGSDYDVDKLASRVKKIIYDDGQYRNVNTINYLR